MLSAVRPRSLDTQSYAAKKQAHMLALMPFAGVWWGSYEKCKTMMSGVAPSTMQVHNTPQRLFYPPFILSLPLFPIDSCFYDLRREPWAICQQSQTPNCGRGLTDLLPLARIFQTPCTQAAAELPNPNEKRPNLIFSCTVLSRAQGCTSAQAWLQAQLLLLSQTRSTRSRFGYRQKSLTRAGRG